MDVQRKKGLLDVCVLAVLQRGPSYGYRIVRDVSACIAVSESTLYPILRRLEANGSVTTETQEHNGRTRRYYAITDMGRARIRTFLNEWEEVKRIYSFIEEIAASGGTAAADGTAAAGEIVATGGIAVAGETAAISETAATGGTAPAAVRTEGDSGIGILEREETEEA